MMLKLNYSLYNGKTLLSSWWKQVKSHFSEVEKAHNSLEASVTAALSAESAARESADTSLSEAITAEIASRQHDVALLYENLDTETAERKAADTAITQSLSAERTERNNGLDSLSGQLNDEKKARERACSSLKSELSSQIKSEADARAQRDSSLNDAIILVAEKAHSHANMGALNKITDAKISSWDDKTDYDTQNGIKIGQLFEECEGILHELEVLYGYHGITVYDGGTDGTVLYSGEPLDGGIIGSDDPTENIVDAGLLSAHAEAAVLDGGIY